MNNTIYSTNLIDWYGLIFYYDILRKQ